MVEHRHMHSLLHSREFADLLVVSSQKLKRRWVDCPVLGLLWSGTTEKVVQESQLRIIVFLEGG